MLIFLITADFDGEDIDIGSAVNDDLALDVDGLWNEVEDQVPMPSSSTMTWSLESDWDESGAFVLYPSLLCIKTKLFYPPFFPTFPTQ